MVAVEDTDDFESLPPVLLAEKPHTTIREPRRNPYPGYNGQIGPYKDFLGDQALEQPAKYFDNRLPDLVFSLDRDS